MVITGKSVPYSFPVSGLIEAGPVVPLHPPKTLEHIIKYFLLSNALPGPIRISHQPGFLSPLCQPAAWASPYKAWQIRTALFFSLFSSP